MIGPTIDSGTRFTTARVCIAAHCAQLGRNKPDSLVLEQIDAVLIHPYALSIVVHVRQVE